MMPAPAAPGIVIAAPRSGSGKTMVTLAVLSALTRRGLIVQPFKCGPDYIDPAFHAAATHRCSFNLDAWAMPPDTLFGMAARGADGADVCVTEGVMGLFDGVLKPGRSGRGSTADIAAHLGWPVVLVLDVSGQAETAAAVALGCASYRDDIEFAGVILNKVASDRQLALMRPAFDRLRLPILGAMPRDAAAVIPERHLGLVQATETTELNTRLAALAERAERHLDLDALLAAAKPAHAADATPAAGAALPPPGQRIALAADAAFSFMYPHVLAGWRAEGAEVIPFSPLNDETPDPHADAVWLPGGYPELHAGRLAASDNFKAGLRAAAARGAAIHGECGGFMVLGRLLHDADGKDHEMLGLLDLETSFATRRLHLGYRRAMLAADCALGRAGGMLYGHEFHYATTVKCGDDALVKCTDASGHEIAEPGARRANVSGTFFHAISSAD